MELSYGQVEATLIAHFRIHPDRVGTFRSRVKQLQRLQFPPGVNVGRGTRMGYSGEHLFKLITAFELISIGLPAQTACNLVERHWVRFSAGYALAALQERNWMTRKKHPQVLAILWIEALHEIQFDRKWSTPIEPSSVSIRDQDAAASELANYDFDRHNARIVLSSGKTLERVLKFAKENARVPEASEHDDEFNRWLPSGEVDWITFKGPYPDRSNLLMRQRLHRFSGTDPDSFTPDGVEEARQFLENTYGPEAPF